jgi:rod shape-determining protein MreC
VAAFGTGGSRSQVRGPSLGFRFTLYAILSMVVMFLDQRHGWMEKARFILQTAAYPIQFAVSSPSSAWGWFSQSFASREALQAENDRLRRQQHELELRIMRYDALARENGELRGLRDALPPVADRWLAAEIVNVELDSLRHRILINRGSGNGVFKAQAVLDDKGVIGQTVHVGLWSAEVILITDPEHAIPVQVERTGLRTIAVGAGDTASLALPYLPGNADVKPGDRLVTSGLGGVFPAGYPVARVSEVHRDAVQPLAQVRATPFADVDTDREVVLVWFRADHPAAPAIATGGDLPIGNKSLKPQPAPPKPKPQAEPAAGSGTPAATPNTTSTKPAAASSGAAPTATNSPTAGPNASAGARKPTTSSGTVNPTSAPPSKKGNPPAPASDAASSTPKEPAAGEGNPATTRTPQQPTPREQ